MARICLLNIGNELLLGKRTNTNATEISAMLRPLGYEVDKVVMISDEHDVIFETLKEELNRHDVLIFTGGLGPTKDDITKEVFCDFFGGKMIIHEETLEHIKELFHNRKRAMNEPSRLQAEVPSSAKVLENKYGTAPGLFFETEHKFIFALPGVPQEMRHLMAEKVIPEIQQSFPTHKNTSVILKAFGIPESEIAVKIDGMNPAIPENINISYLPSFGEVTMELSLPESTENEEILGQISASIRKAIGNAIYETSGKKLEAVLGERLKSKEWTIGLAESCTGGMLAQLLTSVSGSSNYFKGSLVTYWESTKADLLGVSEKMIEEHTVVSEEVAKAMALGARKKLRTSIGLSLTGTAEVALDDPVYDKPVIWIGYSDEFGEKAIKYHFHQDRKSNIQNACNRAMFYCLKQMERKG